MLDTEPAGGDERTDAFRILLFDEDRTVVEEVLASARSRSNVRVDTVADEAAALDRLASDPVECLVADPDALSVDAARFGADVRSVLSGCPLVWLTDREAGTLDDAVLGAATTVVKKGEHREDWEFLFEKARTAARSGAAGPAERNSFKLLVETARDGLYRLDATGEVTYLNESFAEMLGYDRTDLLGTHASRTMAEGELERGQQVVRELLDADERESDLMDVEMRTKGGDRITVAVHFTVLTDDDGTYDGLMGVARDVTERKRRERRLERQNERLEEFASVVSHDLRNPLTVARGQMESLRAAVDGERARRHLDELETSLERMTDIVEDTLTLARHGQTVGETEPVALSALADRCWRNVETADADLVITGGTVIECDPDRLRHVLENLFRNAVEHAGEDVTIRVGRLEDGFYVADDGPGIDPGKREAAFEPGFSTAEDGTGFGLSIVKRIAEAHGWGVRVVDGEDGGARFEVTGVDLGE